MLAFFMRIFFPWRKITKYNSSLNPAFKANNSGPLHASIRIKIMCCTWLKYPSLSLHFTIAITTSHTGSRKAWIRNKESNNELSVTSLNHKYFRNHLEDSLSLGRPLLLEDVREELDPALDNVLEKNFIKSGKTLKVRIAHRVCIHTVRRVL